uniref:Uncharacterized protein n=1 Tax=Podarcis muralis TaxID=64176 RepID=A0A670IZC0_PODMU
MQLFLSRQHVPVLLLKQSSCGSSLLQRKSPISIISPKSLIYAEVGVLKSVAVFHYSDSVMLKPDCFQYFHHLASLEHLGLSRCYQIPPAALLELGDIATLKTLQVFGIVTASSLQLLKATLPRLKINVSHFTPIARPTVGCKRNEQIWGIQCRLSLKSPVGF